jgi:hypothetical protein
VIYQSRRSGEIFHHQALPDTFNVPWFEMIGTARQCVLAQPNEVMEHILEIHEKNAAAANLQLMKKRKSQHVAVHFHETRKL